MKNKPRFFERKPGDILIHYAIYKNAREDARCICNERSLLYQWHCSLIKGHDTPHEAQLSEEKGIISAVARWNGNRQPKLKLLRR